MKIIRSIAEMRAHLAPRRGSAIGLVPTMGALHAGHVSLFRAARSAMDHVLATLFVNPTQFNDAADLAAYPRQESEDARIAEAAGVDALFVPDAAEIYPPDDATAVRVGGAALGWEGDFRPGHFDGVATVCLKLFNIVQPRTALFGQKDAQQVAVIRQVVHDLHLDLRIQVVATVREQDGLALSSRNVRLSADERQRALAIPRALLAGLRAHREGADPVEAARAQLSGLQVDYVGAPRFHGEETLVIAARAGATRLIDNVPLADPERAGMPKNTA
jgi:pantoate--beta-alanine ligase